MSELDYSGPKERVARFRIRELGEVLDRFRLRKHGRKQDLADRVIDYLDKARNVAQNTGNYEPLHDAARVIESVYNRMLQEGYGRSSVFAPPAAAGPSHAPPPPPAPYGSQSALIQPPPYLNSASSGYGVNAGLNAGNSQRGVPSRSDYARMYTEPVPTQPKLLQVSIPPGLQPSVLPPAHGSQGMRCICGSSAPRGELVKCRNCAAVQHADCMGCPALTAGQKRGTHYCERCRVELSDPFWQPIDVSIMLPGKLTPTGRSTMTGARMEPILILERSFTLSASQYELIKKQPAMYRLQISCLQLQDGVVFRQHWPMGCELRVNNVQYRVYTRATGQKMGANQRDEPANIGVLCHRDKPNRIYVQGADSMTGGYAIMLSLVKARSVEQVKGLMQAAETLDQATARIRKELGGGGSTGENGEDSDDELQVTHTQVPLRCPLSGVRISTPARFVDVPGMACFDLDMFLTMVSKSRKWQCPNSMRNSCVSNLQTDTYLAAILHALKPHPDVSEVEIDAQARWRPAGGSRTAELPWHEPGEALKPLPLGNVAIKPEPGTNGDYDDSSEEDEEAELRKAVEAVKRGRPAAPDVIELLDSDDDAGPVPPPSKRPNTTPGVRTNGGGEGPSAAVAGTSGRGADQEVTSSAAGGSGGGGIRFRVAVPPSVAAARASGGASGSSGAPGSGSTPAANGHYGPPPHPSSHPSGVPSSYHTHPGGYPGYAGYGGANGAAPGIHRGAGYSHQPPLVSVASGGHGSQPPALQGQAGHTHHQQQPRLGGGPDGGVGTSNNNGVRGVDGGRPQPVPVGGSQWTNARSSNGARSSQPPQRHPTIDVIELDSD